MSLNLYKFIQQGFEMSTFSNTEIKSIQNPIIMITVNYNGDIFNNSLSTNNPFMNCKNIYEIERLQPYKNILSKNFTTQKLAINIFDKNYSIIQLKQQVGNMELLQFIFMDWRISNVIPNDPNAQVFTNMQNIKNHALIQQEIMCAVMVGLIQDKEIVNFVIKLSSQYTERHIKYNLTMLYKKFNVNTRTSLIQAIKAHDLDGYLPITIVAPGIYDSIFV